MVSSRSRPPGAASGLGREGPIVKPGRAAEGLARPAASRYMQAMLDRFFLPALAVLALGIVALAMVWPQGLGDRSPGPFGSTPVQQTPEMQALMKKETDASEARLKHARDTVADLQSQAVAPGQ